MSKIQVKRIAKLSGHKSAIFTLEESENSKAFFSAGGDGMVVQWNLDNLGEGKLIARVPSNVFSLKYLEKQQLLAVGTLQGVLYFIDLKKNKVIEPPLQFQKAIYDFELFNDKLLVAIGGGMLGVVDIEKNEVEAQYALSTENLRSVDYVANLQRIIIGASDGATYLLDTDFRLKQLLEQHYASVFSTRLLRNQLLLTGARDAHLGVWEYKGVWNNRQYIPAHNYTINCIVEHPQRALVATASRDKTVKIWDALTLDLLKVIDKQKYDGHLNSVNHLLWSSYNNWLISGSDDKTIMIWEIE